MAGLPELNCPFTPQLVSIGNTLIAFAAAPAIIYYTEISYISRMGLASSMVLFGILTTGKQR